VIAIRRARREIVIFVLGLGVLSAGFSPAPIPANEPPARDLAAFESLSRRAPAESRLVLESTLPAVRHPNQATVFVAHDRPGAGPVWVGTREWAAEIGLDIVSESWVEIVYRIAPEEMRRLAGAAAACRAVSRPRMGADTTFAVDLSVRAGEDSARCLVALDHEEMTELWRALWDAASEGSGLRHILAGFGWAHGLLHGSGLEDEIGKVRVEYSGFRPVPGTDDYVGAVTIRNVSTVALPSPVTLVLWPRILGTKIVQPKPSGYTLLSQRWPRPYFELPVGRALEPGESAELRIRLHNPGHQPLEFGCGLYAGEGER
jgi:hypothetical protein